MTDPEGLDRNQLLSLARRRGIAVNVRMTKPDLLAALGKQVESPAPMIVEPKVLEPDVLGFPGQVGHPAS